ncbi:Uncharacterized protein PBTT_02203 [Plasmodiophora brassicae]|uniref:Uncharacterized protein n=1 Tax=Plasmodiophora brassicae TaxID=37360 RepID=A0A0G4J5H7_PLABS|nr:hypothetical protein PBRA_002735 [Plasmodiophora brassicae]SPQ94885.1 unnamed protein product [Plasmodiophora brassicae]
MPHRFVVIALCSIAALALQFAGVRAGGGPEGFMDHAQDLVVKHPRETVEVVGILAAISAFGARRVAVAAALYLLNKNAAQRDARGYVASTLARKNDVFTTEGLRSLSSKSTSERLASVWKTLGHHIMHPVNERYYGLYKRVKGKFIRPVFGSSADKVMVYGGPGAALFASKSAAVVLALGVAAYMFLNKPTAPGSAS